MTGTSSARESVTLGAPAQARHAGRATEVQHFTGSARDEGGNTVRPPPEHGPAHLRALAIELSRELPFISRGWYSVRRELLTLLSHYLGLDLYSLDDTSRRIGTGARGAYWLTFLGQPLLGRLGGLDGLRQQLPLPDVSFENLDGGRALLTLGEWPSALDTREGLPAPSYRALARLLEPYFPEETFPVAHMFDRETMPRWLRRLCQ